MKSPAGESLQRRAAGRAHRSRCCCRAGSSKAVAADLLKRAGYDYDTVKRQARTAAFRPIDLKANFSADIPVDSVADHQPQRDRQAHRLQISRTRRVSSAAIGTPTGSGRPTRQGETIRPGAADDALGLAAMLEDARLFAAGPRPQRTLRLRRLDRRGARPARLRILRAASALPDGDDGREPDLRHAAVRRARSATSVLVGRGQSEMEDYLAAAAKAQGRYVTPENHPERGLFYRADHFSFAKRGVPVLLDMALAGAYDLVDGGRPAGETLARRLHRALATTRPATPGARAGTCAARRRRRSCSTRSASALANSRDWPQWRSTSEFAKVRAQSASARSTGRRKGERGR